MPTVSMQSCTTPNAFLPKPGFCCNPARRRVSNGMIQLDPMKTRFVECPLAQCYCGCRAEPTTTRRGDNPVRETTRAVVQIDRFQRHAAQQEIAGSIYQRPI